MKIGNKAINARAETVAEKRMLLGALKTRRCLVPASGYFESKGAAQNKQPYFIHGPDNTLLLFAGLRKHGWPVKKRNRCIRSRSLRDRLHWCLVTFATARP